MTAKSIPILRLRMLHGQPANQLVPYSVLLAVITLQFSVQPLGLLLGGPSLLYAIL